MISFHALIEFSALFSSIIWCRKKSSPYFVFFIPFLLYTVVNEYAGYYIWAVLKKPNYFIYTIYVPISLIFYSYLIMNWVVSVNIRLAIGIGLCLGVVFSIINATFIQGFGRFNTYSNMVTSVLLILFCLMYLFDLLKQSEFVSNPVKEPNFWVIVGLLFFNFGGLIINILYNYALKNNFKIFGGNMYNSIFLFLNFLMYGSFIIAFRLCHKKKFILQ